MHTDFTDSLLWKVRWDFGYYVEHPMHENDIGKKKTLKCEMTKKSFGEATECNHSNKNMRQKK